MEIENYFFMKVHTTLCIPIDTKEGKILLGLKKRGFGSGRWNGFGGKIGKGETVEQATIRELTEESGLVAKNLFEIGNLEFYFPEKNETILMYIYKTDDYEGQIKESEEMKPQWFAIDQIPYNQMWPDDKLWLPLFLLNKKFLGRVIFSNTDQIINHEISVIEN